MLRDGRMLSQRASDFELLLIRVFCIFGASHPGTAISFTSWVLSWPSPDYLA